MQSPPVLCKHLKDWIGGMKLTWNRLIKEEGSRFGAVKSRGNLVERSKLQGSWSRTYMNELDERSRTTTPFEGFSAQNGKKEREILIVLKAYKCWGLITKVLERLSLARSCVESREYEDVLKILGRVSWCSWWWV